jgi:hypothetical protein
VSAAFELAGELRFPEESVREVTARGGGAAVDGDAVRISTVIGGARAGVVRVRLRGVALRAATPSFRVVATPAPAAALPRPPATSWAAAVRGGLRIGGQRLLETAFRAKLRYERTRQYQSFLGSPAGPGFLGGPAGPSRTTYVFRTIPATLATPTARPERDATDGSTVPLALLAGGALLVGAGLVMLWAHL